MAAINLIINENKLSYEIENNVIILKRKGIIIYEFPIPNNYNLTATLNRFVKNKYEVIREVRFIITNYQLKNPSFIPSNLDEIYISESGLWSALGKDNMKFEYLDTSILSQDDFEYAYYGNPRWNELAKNGFKIPKSFWYSKAYHKQNYSKARNIENVREDIINYNENARLIKEDEAMALVSLDCSFRLKQGMLNNLYGYNSENKDFLIDVIGHLPDNWPILASSIENPNVYRFLIPTLSAICDDEFAANSCLSIDYDKKYPYLVLPVIDEDKDKAKKLSLNA